MCGRKFAASLSLLLLLSLLSPQLGFCEVTLTDREAQEILTELETSRKDLESAMELSAGLKSELEQLHRVSQEQKEYYEKQLKGQKSAWITRSAIAASVCLAGGIMIGCLASR